MRGNPTEVVAVLRPQGSIPAHAGEPAARRYTVSPSRVYPRACGGTPHRQAPRVAYGGLSPRMRGNPASSVSLSLPGGSIPAHAGEP